MPYTNPNQATAVFLDIKRREGLAAAKAWGKKHRKELSAAAKARGGKSYKSRSKRSK